MSTQAFEHRGGGGDWKPALKISVYMFSMKCNSSGTFSHSHSHVNKLLVFWFVFFLKSFRTLHGDECQAKKQVPCSKSDMLSLLSHSMQLPSPLEPVDTFRL